MNLKLTTEAIKYQVGDKFHKQLTEICERIRIDVVSNKNHSNNNIIDTYGPEISRLIKNRTNLSVVPVKEFADIAPMAIIPFSGDMINQLTAINFEPKSTFFSYLENSTSTVIKKINSILKERKKRVKSINNKKGTMDLEKVYVSGYFAEVESYLILNPVLLFTKSSLTAAEVSSTIIHELGHVWHGLEQHYRLATTNVAVSDIMSCIEGNDIPRAKYLYKSTFGGEDLSQAAIDSGDVRNDFYGVLVDRYVKELESHYQQQRYDFVSFEFMADNFASRFGAGQDIVTALDKLNRELNFGINRSALGLRMVSTLYVTAMFVVLGAIGGVGLTIAYGAVLLLIELLKANTPEIYDNFKDRGTRISNDIANILKNRSLPKEEKIILINQYEMIEEFNKVNKNFEPIFVTMWSKIVPSLRKAKYHKEMQQKVEKSLNNPLFVTSAKFDTL